jgi:hypothetical protein
VDFVGKLLHDDKDSLPAGGPKPPRRVTLRLRDFKSEKFAAEEKTHLFKPIFFA